MNEKNRKRSTTTRKTLRT
ncbi:hypothetical protein Nmel_006132 [Mimus melanotis]